MVDPSDGQHHSAWTSVRDTLALSDVRQVLILTFLAAAILSGQIANEVLYSVDGIVYALVGKELTLKPLSQWAILTWNGSPFYEHPHLTPWLIGASMKLFGVRTGTAILPVLLISFATVLLTYFMGRALLDHRLGLLAGTVLTLTPAFVKGGRNPMLEPALMLFVMLAVYFHLAAAPSGKLFRSSILSGLCLGLAFLAKGPPAVLALAVIVAFQCTGRAFPDVFRKWLLSPRQLVAHVMALVLIAGAVVMLVDLWHRGVAGTSFFAHYLDHQLRFTIVEGRGAATNDWLFYVNTFFKGWPWWPFILISVPIVLRKSDWKAVPALVLGGLVTVGTYAGFTLMTHKSAWYVAIHFVGSSLLAALTLRYLVSPRVLDRYYGTLTLSLVVAMLFLSASVPSLFLQYGRPFEWFMERARADLGRTLEGEALAVCVPVDPWKAPFFVSFYLGARKVDCTDATARFKVVDHRNYVMESGIRLLFSQEPFSILERRPD